jgi:hypothetical protein
MPAGVGVKEVFAGLPKAYKAFFQKATVLLFNENVSSYLKIAHLSFPP